MLSPTTQARQLAGVSVAPIEAEVSVWVVLKDPLITGMAVKVETVDTEVKDNLLTLNKQASGQTPPADFNSGIEVDRGSDVSKPTLRWNNLSKKWQASFDDLGIDAYQTVNMYATASENVHHHHVDRVPDSGGITWSPIPILGWQWLIVIVALVVGFAWYTRGRFEWRRSSLSG